MVRTGRRIAAGVLVIAMPVVAFAACGGESTISGPISGADGRIIFAPASGVTLRGADLRGTVPRSPNDNRWIQGSGAWFDPGAISAPASEGSTPYLGTLTVNYRGLTLPAGTLESGLYLAWWDSRSWIKVEGSTVNPTDRTVRAPLYGDFGARQYAILGDKGMYVRIEDGPDGRIGGDSLRVVVWTRSDVDVTSVAASVAGRQVTLTPESPWGPYTGHVPLTGLARGEHVLRVTATRTDGLAISDTAIVTKNVRPVVTVVTPAPGATVGQTFRLTVTCTDDDPRGCRSLDAWAQSEGGRTRIGLATGTSSIDRDVSLGGLRGQILVVITGSDYAERYDRTVTLTLTTQ